MTSRKTYESDAFEAVHGAVAGMLKTGTVDKKTMVHFDALCLTAPQAMAPARIKALREATNESQPLFARYLDTSESTVEKWETGAKKPSAMALKLLSLVEKHGIDILA